MIPAIYDMSFRDWLLQEVQTESILQHVYESIANLLNGQWVVLGRKKYTITYAFQMKEHMDIGGTGVKKFGDRFQVRCFVVVAKHEGTIEPYPGYFQGKWSHQKDLDWRKPYTDMSNYDPKTGHNLISFYGSVYGAMFGHEDISKYGGGATTIEDPQEHPLGSFRELMKRDPFSEDLERIGGFGYEQGSGSAMYDKTIKTPFEVAKVVKKIIDNWTPPKDDDDEEPPVTPEIAPSGTRIKVH